MLEKGKRRDGEGDVPRGLGWGFPNPCPEEVECGLVGRRGPGRSCLFGEGVRSLGVGDSREGNAVRWARGLRSGDFGGR